MVTEAAAMACVDGSACRTAPHAVAAKIPSQSNILSTLTEIPFLFLSFLDLLGMRDLFDIYI